MCYRNGGGAFLVPYLIFMSVVGIPLFFMESCIAQFTSCGPTTCWEFAPLVQGQLALVSTDSVSLTKIICDRNFGNEFGFTHSKYYLHYLARSPLSQIFDNETSPQNSVYTKVQVGKDQEKAQSEKDSHSKNRGGKKPN